MNTQALHPSSLSVPTAFTPQLAPPMPTGGVSRFLGPLDTSGTNAMAINSLGTPQLTSAYTPTIASMDIVARTPLHRPEAHFNSPPRREGTLQLTWDVENQLEFTLDPAMLQSGGDSIELPGGFPQKVERGTSPMIVPDSILLPRAQAPTPFAMQKGPAQLEHSPSPRSAFPPSAFNQRFSSQNLANTARPPSPMPGTLASPVQLLPRSPVGSLRNVELEHPRPVRPVQMTDVDDAGSIASLLPDLPSSSPAPSVAIGRARPDHASAISTPLHSAGLAVPSPFSRADRTMERQHGSPASQSMRAQLGCEQTTEVSSIPFPTKDDPPVQRGARPVPTTGLTIGRERANGACSHLPAPLSVPDWAVFPPSPFAICSPLPSAALQAPLPFSPSVNSFLDVGNSGSPNLQAPSISSAPFTDEQRAEHRVRGQAFAERRVEAVGNASPLPFPRNQAPPAQPTTSEWDEDFFEKYGLFGSAALPPSRESSGDDFYRFIWDRDPCQSPEQISSLGYSLSPPPNKKKINGLEELHDLGLWTVGSGISCERRNPPSMGRIEKELKGKRRATREGAERLAADRDRRKEEWFIGTMFARMGDIHSRMKQVDMRLQNVQTVVSQPVQIERPELALEAPIIPDRHCVTLEHFAYHTLRKGQRVPDFISVFYRWDHLFDLTNRLDRDFWFGGGDDADTMGSRYMCPVRFDRFETDQGASVLFDCRQMLQDPEPLRFVIVEEVLDFMRQMLNAVAKLHAKTVYHGAISSSTIGIYGSEMLRRQYVLFPCARELDLTFGDGQALDMYHLGHVFMDLLVQSPIFKAFDDLTDWMTGITKPHQISIVGALWMFEDIVKKKEVFQQSYMTIYRPWCDSDDKSSVNSAPQTVYPSSTSEEASGGSDSRDPTRENTGATSVTPIPPRSRENSAESLELDQTLTNEVVVVDDTSFVMSPLAAKGAELPARTRRSIVAGTLKTLGKMKRWLTRRQ